MSKRPRVLLIDELKALVSIDAGQALSGDFEIIAAGSAQDASAQVEAHEPEVVVIDCDLEDADGYAYSTRLREAGYDGRVLIATSTDDPEEQRAVREAGADGLIVKPIESSALREAIWEAINVHRRKHTRVPIEIAVDYTVGGDQAFLDRSVNLSMGGIFIRTAEPLELDTVVKLRFTIPGESNDHRIETDGVVAWSQPRTEDSPEDINPGMGIRFDKLSETDHEVLRKFVVETLDELGLSS